jgi:N-acetylglucosaminyl-diphospho-decaprenol L-rhamnosyltransferase
MRRPTVCAIVLDYYGAEKTKNCLISLIGQGLKTIYVLDNSDDRDASAMLQKVVDEVQGQGPEFELNLICAGRNLGFGKGVNYVIAHDKHTSSPHDYYLLLNNDAVARQGLVTNMLSRFREDDSIALVSPRVECKGSGPEFGFWYHRYFGLLLSRPGHGRFHYFTGCCLLFPKSLVATSGIFDESFFMYGEDAELSWRMARLGMKTICADNAFVEHDYGSSVERSSFFYEYHMARGHLLLSRKTCIHPMEIPLLFLAKLVGLSARATARSYRYRTMTPFLSLLVAWLPLRVDKT